MERQLSPEEAMMRRIETGSCQSADFQLIMESGDRGMKEALLKKEQEALKNKAHLDRMYGPGNFDNYDQNGNPMKHYTLDNVL